MGFLCQCCVSVCSSFSRLLSHYRKYHETEVGFRLICGLEGKCTKEFSCTRSWMNHIRRKHDSFHSMHVKRKGSKTENTADGSQITIETNDDEHPVPPPETPNSTPEQPTNFMYNDSDTEEMEETQNDFEEQIAKCLLNLQDKHKITQEGCSIIAKEISNIVAKNNDEFQQKCKADFESKNLHTEEIGSVIESNKMEQTNGIGEICHRISKPYQLKKYADENLPFLHSKSIFLGNDDDSDDEHSNTEISAIEYVPINKSLINLLKHEDVLADISIDKRSTDGAIRSFVDSENFRENPFYQQNPNALRLELYHDDFGAANPLGPYSKKWKVSAVYFILGNLSRKHRSRLDNIQLVSLCLHTSTVSEYGLQEMFKPAIDDLKILETQGIQFEFEGRSYHFLGTMSLLTGDNLGCHGAGCFYECFSTPEQVCRFCLTGRFDYQGIFNDRTFTYRTKEAHDVHVARVQRDPKYLRAYGVKGPSKLNELQHYHIIWGMPSCIAHDLFEGIVPETIILVLKRLVGRKLFTYKYFNEKLKTFEYADVDKPNKPLPLLIVQGQPKLKGTQSQMWCLLRLLPLVIGHKLEHLQPRLDEWELILSLQDMVEAVCSRVFYPEDIQLLQDKIETFLVNLHKCFPSNTKPKQHYLTHYPKQVLKTGPIVDYMTLRLEGKHSVFKSTFQQAKCKKNVLKTLAEKHQLRQALRNDKEHILSDELNPIGRKSIQLSELTSHQRLLLGEVFRGTVPDVFSKVKRIHIDHIQYSVEDILVKNYNDSLDSFEFAEISEIFDIEGDIYFLCKIMFSDYNRHYHSYELEDTGRKQVLMIRNLLDIFPLGKYELKDKAPMVVFKHSISIPAHSE